MTDELAQNHSLSVSHFMTSLIYKFSSYALSLYTSSYMISHASLQFENDQSSGDDDIDKKSVAQDSSQLAEENDHFCAERDSENADAQTNKIA